MGANSIPRKIIKNLLVPFPRLREYLQTIAMAKDIYTDEWAKKNEPEIFWIKSTLKPGDVAIGVGANYGLYTYNLSKTVGNDGLVYAFEPIPYTFRTLKRITRIFRLNNVELINKGCSNSVGKIKFSVPNAIDTSSITSGSSIVLGFESSKSVILPKASLAID